MAATKRITVDEHTHYNFKSAQWWSDRLQHNIREAADSERRAIRESSRRGAHGVTEWMVIWADHALAKTRAIETARRGLKLQTQRMLERLGIEGVKVEVVS